MVNLNECGYKSPSIPAIPMFLQNLSSNHQQIIQRKSVNEITYSRSLDRFSDFQHDQCDDDNDPDVNFMRKSFLFCRIVC